MGRRGLDLIHVDDQRLLLLLIHQLEMAELRTHEFELLAKVAPNAENPGQGVKEVEQNLWLLFNYFQRIVINKSDYWYGPHVT